MGCEHEIVRDRSCLLGNINLDPTIGRLRFRPDFSCQAFSLDPGSEQHDHKPPKETKHPLLPHRSPL